VLPSYGAHQLEACQLELQELELGSEQEEQEQELGLSWCWSWSWLGSLHRDSVLHGVVLESREPVVQVGVGVKQSLVTISLD
jgi:hypothetical protein